VLFRSSLQPNEWIHGANDDIAVCPIELDPKVHKVGYVPSEYFLTQDLMQQYRVGPGHLVFSVGRFKTHDGKQRNLPVVRWGNIAMLPWVPISHPRGYLQDSFLVEARSFSGYSGSPVFLSDDALPWENAVWPPPASSLSGSPRWTPPPTLPDIPTLLLGINWGNMEIGGQQKLLDRSGNILPYNVIANSGMSQVVPAWKLQELLDKEELVKQRVEEGQEIERKRKRSTEG